MNLTDHEKALLDGAHGEAQQLAMRALVDLGKHYGVERFVEIAACHDDSTVFLGEAAAVAYGDYITGANHVLPTGGLARSFSSLSTLHYLRMYTWQEITAEAAAALAPSVERMAEAEGLPGHAAAARARREEGAP